MKQTGPFLLLIAFAFTSSVWAESPATFAPLSLSEMPAAPASQQAAADDWKFNIAVPLWLPSVDGNMTVKGRELSLDQDTGDTIDALDSHINGAFLMHFEAQKSRVGLLLDVMYLDLRAEGNGDVTDATGSLKGFVGEVGGFYSLIAPPPGKKGWGAVTVDVLGGVRVSALEFGINGDNFGGSVNRTVYDPFVGARIELGLAKWVSLKARGDVGGFGIDAWPTSDPVYNLAAGVEFHLAEWFDLGLGYRWLSYDFEGNSANSSFDAMLSGPFVALSFNF